MLTTITTGGDQDHIFLFYIVFPCAMVLAFPDNALNMYPWPIASEQFYLYAANPVILKRTLKFY